MVKSYLRYVGSESIGVIASGTCNIAGSHDGKCALTGCVDAVGVWSVRQGSRLRLLNSGGPADQVTRLCLKDADPGVCAAGYLDGSVRLWNYEITSCLQTLQGHRSGISCLVFSRTGHHLASGSSDTDIVVWDVVSETGLCRLRGHHDQVTSLQFWEETPESAGSGMRLVSGSKDRAIRIWSVELQLCLQLLADHRSEVWSLALDTTQTILVAGSTDDRLRVWQMGTGPNAEGSSSGVIQRLPQAKDNVLGLSFIQPPGLDFEVLVCQGSSKVIELFRRHHDEEMKRKRKRRKKRALEKEKKKSKLDSTEALEGDADKGVEANAEVDEEEFRAADAFSALPPYRTQAKLRSFAWCPKTGMLLLGLGNNSVEAIRLVQGTSGSEEQASTNVDCEQILTLDLPGHRSAVRSLSISHDDSLVLSTSAEALKVWNVATGHCVRTLASGYGLCGFFVAGNEHVVVGTKEGCLELFDLNAAEKICSKEVHQGAIWNVAQHPSNEGFASASADKHIRCFNLQLTGSSEGPQTVSFEPVPQGELELPDECLAVQYSANGKWIAAAMLNHQVQLYFADTLKFYLALYGHRLPVLTLDITSDSQMLASGSADKNIKLWSTQFGNCHRSLRAHEDSVMQVRFMKETHYLISTGRDREVRLWDCDSYEMISSLRGHGSEVLSLAVSQDAAFMVSASTDRQIRFWRRTGEQLFLTEERTKELEEKFEADAVREDVQQPANQVFSVRPSRRTLESVRTTERLMEVLDEASQLSDTAAVAAGVQGVKLPNSHLHVMKYLGTLTMGNIYEVLLALPFSYSMNLLRFLCDFLEAASGLHDGSTNNRSSLGRDVANTLGLAGVLETICRAVLITVHVHHRELAVTPSGPLVLQRFRRLMRQLLQAERDCVGFNLAAIDHLQREVKRKSGFTLVSEKSAKEPVSKERADRKQKRKKI